MKVPKPVAESIARSVRSRGHIVEAKDIEPELNRILNQIRGHSPELAQLSDEEIMSLVKEGVESGAISRSAAYRGPFP